MLPHLRGMGADPALVLNLSVPGTAGYEARHPPGAVQRAGTAAIEGAGSAADAHSSTLHGAWDTTFGGGAAPPAVTAPPAPNEAALNQRAAAHASAAAQIAQLPDSEGYVASHRDQLEAMGYDPDVLGTAVSSSTVEAHWAGNAAATGAAGARHRHRRGPATADRGHHAARPPTTAAVRFHLARPVRRAAGAAARAA